MAVRGARGGGGAPQGPREQGRSLATAPSETLSHGRNRNFHPPAEALKPSSDARKAHSTRRVHIEPCSVGVSECQAVSGRCRGGVGAVSIDTGVGVSGWCQTSVRQCQAILTVPTCVQCQWCVVSMVFGVKTGPVKRDHVDSSAPGDPQMQMSVPIGLCGAYGACDNTQFTLGISCRGRAVHVVPFHSWPCLDTIDTIDTIDTVHTWAVSIRLDTA